MLAAVDYLHSEGVAHLDLKPENFLVSYHGVKLIDFDFSHKVTDELNSGMKGTPSYRAPEWASKSMKDYKKADVYSLGVTLFTIVVGWAPFEEIEKETDVFEFDLHYKTLRSDANEFWKIHEGFLKQEGRDGLSSEFKTLIEGMLVEEPEKRVNLEFIKNHSWAKDEVHDVDELEALIKIVLSG
jgi:serine/threonine protein kinase